MRNLHHLCTYHAGTAHEKIFKITASFLILFTIVLISRGTDWTYASEQEAEVVAPGVPVAPLPPPIDSRGNVMPSAVVMPNVGDDFRNMTPEVKEKMMQVEQQRMKQEQAMHGDKQEKEGMMNNRPTEQHKFSPDELNKAEQNEGNPEQMVDPRQVLDALRQIGNMRRELARFERQLKKTPNDTATQKIQELKTKLDTDEAAIKNEQSQDALQNFFEEQLGDDVNTLRAQVELPKELHDIKRELGRLEKILALATFKKWIILDPAKLQENVSSIKAALADAEAKLTAGDGEGAMEALQSIHDGNHPGEIMGVLYRLRDIGQGLNRLRDQDIKTSFTDLLEPVISAANDGDFREANQSLNEMMPDLQRLMMQAGRGRHTSQDYQDKFSKLEQKIQQKFGQGNQFEPGADQSNNEQP